MHGDNLVRDADRGELRVPMIGQCDWLMIMTHCDWLLIPGSHCDWSVITERCPGVKTIS